MRDLPASYDNDMTSPPRIYLGYSPFGEYIGYVEEEEEEDDDE